MAASVISVAGSLAAAAVLVAISTAIFPATRISISGYSDYAELTVIGVVIARLAWPVESGGPDQLRAPLAVLAYGCAGPLVLWLPDLYIVAKGEPLRAVAVLIVEMHLAIAIITYNCIVRIARVEQAEAAKGGVRPSIATPAAGCDGRGCIRRGWRGPGSGVPGRGWRGWFR